MNFDGGTVRYNIEVNTQDFERSLDALDKEFDRLDKKYNSLFAAGLLDEKEIKKIEELKNNLESYGKVLEESEEGTEEYEYALKSANKAMDEFASALGEVKDAAEETDTPMQSLSETIGNLASKAGLSALKGLATGVSTALVGLAKKGISATNFLETSQIGMAGLLGSMEQGTKALSVAANFWQNNPFNRFDVTSATKQLTQYGRTVEQLPKDLEILGNVSLSTGVNIENLAYSYGRVAASGRAMTRDIEIMANKGVPIWRELSKQLGTTQQGVRELASRGQVDFETFRKAMESAVNPEAMAAYEKTLARQQDRLSGSLSILAGDLAGYKIVNDELEISVGSLYENWVKLINTLATSLRSSGLRDGLTKIGQVLGSAINKLMGFYEVVNKETGKVEQHSKTLETAFGVISKVVDFIGEHGALLVPIFAGALSVVTKLTSQIPVLGNLFGGLSNTIIEPIKFLLKEKPAIAGLIALIGVGLVNAYKNSESFRESIKKLMTSIGQIAQKLTPIITAFVQAFADLASSYAVITTLELIAAVLADIAGILASMPTEVLAIIVGLIVGLKLSSLSPWLLWGSALALAYSWIKKLVEDAGGLKTVLNNIGTAIRNFFNSIFEFIKQYNLVTIGQNFVTGFFNGARDALREGKNALFAGFQGLITGIKNIFGIHSPSTVMYGIGQNLGIGLANGIEDSQSAVQKAMDNLAKDVLKQAQKVIGNMSDFGLIDYNGTYKEWKKVANLFTIGSEQYESAIEKMEDARKNVNLEIIKLQKEYNETLDNSISKIQKFYDVFDEVSTKGGKNATQIIKNLDKQVAQTAEWAEAQKIINQSGLDPKFIEELKNMGVESVSELSSIANMTSSELEQLNELWLKKQSIAEESAVSQLQDYKNEVLDQISDLADGIDGETVKVKEEGGRLVASIGEGVTGALPTLQGSFAKLNDYIADAQRELKKTASSGTGIEDVFTTGNPDDPTGLKEWGEQIKQDVEQFAQKLSGWLLAGIGIIAAIKFGPSIIKAISGGISAGGGLSNLLGGLLGKTGVDKATGMGSVDLSGINKLTNSLTGAGKSMSKLDKVYLAIAKGAALVLLIAADIWAISSAIKKMNENLKGIEWADFGSNLGMMAATIATFAVLAGVMGIGPIAAAIAIGGAIMLELAVDIAAIATAIGYMDRAIPNDIDRIKPKIGLMAEAVLSFEALTALAGLFAALEGLGILAVLGIAEEIKQVAHALREVDENIPDDIDRVGKKVQFLADTIRFINNVGLGEVIQSIVTSFSTGPVKKIAQMYAEVAYYLGEISKVNIDFEHTRDNVVFIKDTIDFLQTQTDAITGSLNALREKAEADTVEQAARILIIFGQVVDSLNKIASLDVKQTDIVKGVQQIAKCVETVGTTLKTITYTHLGSAEGNVEKIKNIIEDFGSIVPTLNDLAKGENRLNTTEVEGVVSDMDSIFAFMKDKLMGMGSFTNREKHVAAAKGIIESFDGIAKTAKTLTDADHTFDIGTEKSGLKKQIIDVADIINTLKEKLYVKTGFGTVEKQMGEVQSVLNKFSEMSLEMKKQLTDAYLIDEETHGKIKANIENIRNLVWEIEQINTSGFNDLENKVKVVESAKTIAEKFAGFADAMRAINTEGMADAGVLTDAAYRLLDGIKTGVTDKLPDMDNLGGELATHIANGAIASYDQLYAAGTQIQSAVWNGVQDKFADEYQQGIYLAYSLRDGIYSVVGQFQKVGADIQSQFWWGVQNRMGDEYNQGKAMGNTLRQGMYDVDYANAGWWAVQGFINGANNRAYGYQGVYHTGWWVADTFLRGLKDRGGQGSPWKTTIESGIFAGQGLVEGLKQMESEVIDEAEVLADGIVEALDISDTTVSPELNLRGSLAPMVNEDYGYSNSGRGVVVNMENNVYTDLDMAQVERDLSYSLAKI